MKKVLLLLIFLIPLVYAVDCAHFTTEKFQEEVIKLSIKNTSAFGGDGLIFSDFTNGNNKSSFMAYNPNKFEVLARFTILIEGHGKGERQFAIRIPQQNFMEVSHFCTDGSTMAECVINDSSISYFVSDPQLMLPKKIKITKTREVCCPEGTLSCENKCLPPNAKNAPEPYLCDWECQSGIGINGICKLKDEYACASNLECESELCNSKGYCGPDKGCILDNNTLDCNGTCAIPSSRQVGEKYSCEWECTTEYGKDNICKQTPLVVFYYILLALCTLSLISAITWITLRKGLSKIEQEKRIKKIEELNKFYEEEKIKILTDEQNLKKKSRQNKITKADLEIQVQELAKLKAKTEKLKEGIISEREKYKREKFKPYKNMQGVLVHLNENGYEVFADSKKLFHRWWYTKNKGPIPAGHEIHHKNGIKTDNQINNLEALSKKDHQKIHGIHYF